MSIHDFLNHWQEWSYLDLVKNYLPHSHRLLFEDEEIVRKVTRILINNMRRFARRYSPIYQTSEFMRMIDKNGLASPRLWFVPQVPCTKMCTSGTTTGTPFHYLRWKDTFEMVEGNLHYKMILDEFNIGNSPSVLFLLLEHHLRGGTEETVIEIQTKEILQRHGHPKARVHLANANRLYQTDQNKYFEQLLNYIKHKPIDVILTGGPLVSSLAYHAERLGVDFKLCKLLSNTCEPMPRRDVELMKRNGLIDAWCDHMRCWDGGASFFSCRFGTYHLMDNLSYSVSIEDKLLCTDYFSFPSPFVNYWNGDYARIEENYKRCDCGRLYRPFEWVSARPFSYHGFTSEQLRSTIESTEIEVIKSVRCHHKFIEFVTSKELTKKEKDALSSVLSGFSLHFLVEA